MSIRRFRWFVYDALAQAAKRSGLYRTRFAGVLFHSGPALAFRRALISRGASTVEVHGSIFKVPDAPVYAPGMLRGVFEPRMTSLLGDLIKPGDTVADVGANVGYHTLFAAKRAGEGGRVFAFEPHPVNRTLLEQNLALNDYGNVTVVAAAVSDSEGTTRLMQGFGPGVSSLYDGPLTRDGSIEVDVITLDGYFERAGWPPVDVMKMDIEGAESSALAGMTELSRRNPGLKLVVEFGVDLLEASGSSPERFFQLLTELGFTKFSNVKRDLEPINIPEEIPAIVKSWHAFQIDNILCEKGS